MPSVTLPDNSIRLYDDPVTVEELAADIGSGLAKATVAGRVNGKLVDASEFVANLKRTRFKKKPNFRCCHGSNHPAWI